jgi:hypothetical protein
MGFRERDPENRGVRAENRQTDPLKRLGRFTHPNLEPRRAILRRPGLSWTTRSGTGSDGASPSYPR